MGKNKGSTASADGLASRLTVGQKILCVFVSLCLVLGLNPAAGLVNPSTAYAEEAFDAAKAQASNVDTLISAVEYVSKYNGASGASNTKSVTLTSDIILDKDVQVPIYGSISFAGAKLYCNGHYFHLTATEATDDFDNAGLDVRYSLPAGEYKTVISYGYDFSTGNSCEHCSENCIYCAYADPIVTYVATIGDQGYETLDAALAAVKDGETIVLAEGTFESASVGAVANLNGKSFTIRGAGADKTTFVIGKEAIEGEGAGDYRFEGASVSFDNLKIQTKNRNINYCGFIRTKGLSFTNCTFYGRISGWGNGAVIDNCVFDNTDLYEYALWTYGSDLIIRNTTFNTQGKAIKLYGGSSSLVIENCVFNSNGQHAGANKPCIAVANNNVDGNYTVSIDKLTTQTGFVAGVVGNAFWGTDTKDDIDTAKTLIVNGAQIYPATTVEVTDGKEVSVTNGENSTSVDNAKAAEAFGEEAKEAAQKATVVTGVVLTTESTATEDSGVQTVVDAAKDASAAAADAIEAASEIKVTVSVKAEPKKDTAKQTVSFTLTPTATVEAKDANGTTTATVTDIAVDNELIDQQQDILVSAYCDFDPEYVVHIANDGSKSNYTKGVVPSDETFVYDATTKTVKFVIHHFSEAVFYQSAPVVAKVGDKTYPTLWDAFKAANGATITSDVYAADASVVPEGFVIDKTKRTISINDVEAFLYFGLLFNATSAYNAGNIPSYVDVNFNCDIDFQNAVLTNGFNADTWGYHNELEPGYEMHGNGHTFKNLTINAADSADAAFFIVSNGLDGFNLEGIQVTGVGQCHLLKEPCRSPATAF